MKKSPHNNTSGPYLRLRSGRRFYPGHITVDMIDPGDIAHALGNLCRFGGHTSTFYSVAEHCMLCALQGRTAEESLALLLHDASEAYLVDVPRPIKKLLGGYKEIESRLMRVIEERFGLPAGILESDFVKAVDNSALIFEAERLIQPDCAKEWGYVVEPLRICPEDNIGMAPALASSLYASTLHGLMRKQSPASASVPAEEMIRPLGRQPVAR
jgi:hypothetical protein